jgi:hypothetical protein
MLDIRLGLASSSRRLEVKLDIPRQAAAPDPSTLRNLQAEAEDR